MNELSNSLSNIDDRVLLALSRGLDDVQVVAVAEMEGRTLAGRDVDEDAFVPYSRSYARYKRRLGRGSGVSRVNLYLTGQMLGALDAERTGAFERTVLLRGAEANEKAVWHQRGTRRMPRRRWFGLSEQQQAEILRLLRTTVDEYISKGFGRRFTERIRVF